MTDGRPTDSAIQRFARLTAAAGAGLILGTWQLWLPDEGPAALPAVPFLAELPVLGLAAATVLLAATLAALAAVIVSPNPRPAAGVAVLLLAAMVAQDQHRCQAWTYQFGLVLLAVAGLPAARATHGCRWVLVGLYAHSGLSKLDVAFLTGSGRQFTAVLLPAEVGPELRLLATAVMPVGELLLGAALAWPATRRVGVALALAQHSLLLAILGPWGLDHSVGVLGWNGYFLLAVPVLFWPEPEPEPEQSAEPMWAATRVLEWALVGAAMVLPLGERFGLIDPWPAWALYASHVERTQLDVDAEDAGALPAELAEHLGPTSPDGMRRLDLSAWSLRRRAAPPNPAHRAQLGLAAGLAERFPDLRWRLTWRGPTGFISTERATRTCWGAVEIRAAATDAEGRFWLSAQPAFPSVSAGGGPLIMPSASSRSLRSATVGSPSHEPRLLTPLGLAGGAGAAGTSGRR